MISSHVLAPYLRRFPLMQGLSCATDKGDAETNSVPDSSPEAIFDGAIANDNRNFVPLEPRNQYDITDARFHDVSLKQVSSSNKQLAAGGTVIVPLNNGYGEASSNTHEVFTGPLLSKRFNEFVGKRGVHDEDGNLNSGDTLPDDDFSTLGILVSSPETYQAEHEHKLFNQASIEGNIITENMMRHLNNELRNDQRLKREYEFVGKRNYDFVGKRNYDFVGKRSYDFVGKRQPFHFIYRKSDNFLNKRAPYEFVGKRNQNIDGDIPSWQTRQIPNMFHVNGLPDLYLNAPDFDDTSKRYSEFLGKRKRSLEDEEAGLSTTERLAALLQNNGLRKRLSRLLLNQHSLEHYPGFVGK